MKVNYTIDSYSIAMLGSFDQNCIDFKQGQWFLWLRKSLTTKQSSKINVQKRAAVQPLKPACSSSHAHTITCIQTQYLNFLLVLGQACRQKDKNTYNKHITHSTHL